MTHIMTPMTDGQIDKAVAVYRAMLCKHRSEFGSAEVQLVLGQPGYVAEQVAVLRNRIEAQGNIIIRHVRVNRTITQVAAIKATGRNEYLDNDVVASMPQGEGDEVDVYFIPIKQILPAKDVAVFLAQYELVPDPRAQAAVNEQDSAFADKHPNFSQWSDNCYLLFNRWSDERSVDCNRNGDDWGDYWFVSGVRSSCK